MKLILFNTDMVCVIGLSVISVCGKCKVTDPVPEEKKGARGAVARSSVMQCKQ